MNRLSGKWAYRSFRHDPIVLKNGEVDGDPELAAVWSPPGELEVETRPDGEVSGTLRFAPGIALEVSGHVYPSTEDAPASVLLTGKGMGSVNRIKGYFVPGSNHVVGTILCTANDLRKQPNGTIGPFVLVPVTRDQAVSEPERVSKSILDLTSGAQPMRAALYSPTGPVTGLVVIAYGSDGLTDDLGGPWKTMIEGYAVSLAEEGFAAVIPDYLAVTHTRAGPAVFDAISQHKTTWQAALSDAIDQVIALLKIDRKRVGLLGFSLGGHLALSVRSKAKVLVEFFAPVLNGIGSTSALKYAQIHHGEADRLPGTEFSNAVAIESALKGEGTATELFAYPGAGHGFISEDQTNRNARDLSKARTLAFFKAHL